MTYDQKRRRPKTLCVIEDEYASFSSKFVELVSDFIVIIEAIYLKKQYVELALFSTFVFVWGGSCLVVGFVSGRVEVVPPRQCDVECVGLGWKGGWVGDGVCVCVWCVGRWC